MTDDRKQHTIRLNSAWEVRCLKDWPTDALHLSALTDDAEPAIRVNLPCAETTDLPIDDPAALVLTRRFNRPSNLSPDQSVTLLIDGLPKAAALYFNGMLVQLVSEQNAASLTIGDRVADNNRLDLVLRDDAFLKKSSVRLVIEESQSR